MSTPAQLLQQHQLRSTPARQQVLAILLETPYALSQVEIEKRFSIPVDRVTVYRSLLTLLESGLLRRVPDGEHGVKFRLRRADEDPLNSHFKCRECGHISPLPDVHIQPLHLPAGFVAQEETLLVIGTCKDCNETRTLVH